MRITLVIFAGILILSGCSGKYTPPSFGSPGEYSVVIDESFDETWGKVIDYSSSTFFSIDNFEKESGLLTLEFGGSDPSSFIDCGNFEAKSPKVNYNGSYVGYLETYANGNLAGKMNISIKPVSETKTRVRVNARYIFSAIMPTNPPSSYKWVFDTGSSKTLIVQNNAPGTSPRRTCKPTYAAESNIIEGIKVR